jgi:hypothetical protein
MFGKNINILEDMKFEKDMSTDRENMNPIKGNKEAEMVIEGIVRNSYDSFGSDVDELYLNEDMTKKTSPHKRQALQNISGRALSNTKRINEKVNGLRQEAVYESIRFTKVF